MKRWVDVDPTKWFYRSILDSDRIKANLDAEGGIINSNTYNSFEEGYERKVHTFVSKENQMEFACPGYKPHVNNLVYVYIDGVMTAPASTEVDKVFIANPISSGVNVVIVVAGVPKKVQRGVNGCSLAHAMSCSNYTNPHAELEEKDNYTADVGFSLNEYVYAMGKSLKRIQVNKLTGESPARAAYRVMGLRKDCFTIIDGYVFVSMEYNDIPILVNYNYVNDKGQIINRVAEKVTPHSACPAYNDRFNPNYYMMRYEFYTIINRLRENLYRRYTDSDFTNTNINVLTRTVHDSSDFIGTWYAEPVLNILEEKFLDGCYVMPLYEDGTFRPTECITRAEMVVALNRYMEWALERFK